MNECRNDFELLQAFTRQGDQAAFAELVRRHLDLVYATSFRKTQDQGVAQELSQNVFAALAGKAWRFTLEDSLPAWLYRTTLLESKKWLRGEMRRRRREQAAAELGTIMNTPQDQPALRALVPLLDEALSSLREKDRTALLLRFYENRPLRAVGLSLGIGEDAAQKRVAAAVQKLADYFQRRGFRTATAGAVSAMLQHTASSAPVAVANAVLLASAELTPGAAFGLAGYVARLAALSKAQTVAVCAALLVTPITWQWCAQRPVRAQLLGLQTQLRAARVEHATLQSEIDRFERDCLRLSETLADEEALAAKRASDAERFSAWKRHLREILTAGDYHWPEDSPFVRIPKSVVKQLEAYRPVRPPGILTQPARELLGLTPDEREKVEGALQVHFSAIDRLIEDNLYETNMLSQYAARFGIPTGASASKVWTVPALGEDVNAQSQVLQESLQEALGPERYALVQGQMGIIGTDTLRRILNLDAGENPQQLAVWISNDGDRPTVGYGWQGNGGAFTQNGVPLAQFRPGTEWAGGINPAEFISSRTLPTSLVSRIMNWLQQQAASLPENESAK